MHGRVKTRSTAEQQEAKRKEREKKVKLYRTGIDTVFKKRSDGTLDEEVLQISGQLLSANPDIYTLWNLRREVILHFRKERCEDDIQKLLEAELQLTEQCLKVNPKSYGAWHYRAWLLETMPRANWCRELSLCNRYLELDERNFHTWNYRQFVVQQSKVPAAEEFLYSTDKITTNFSNYSSWHYRSRLLPSIYPDPQGKRPIREDKHKEELELVQNAAFTDPNDQSAWFYQRWLLGRAHQPLQLSQVLVSPDLVCVVFTQSVRLQTADEGTEGNAGSWLQIYAGTKPLLGSWVACNGQQSSHVWLFELSHEVFQGDNWPSPMTVTLMSNSKMADSLLLQANGREAWTYRKTQFGVQFSEGLTSVLQDELQSCLQLLELEPDSKWTLLTTVLLMQAIDRQQYKEDTMHKLSILMAVDPLRAGYYKDLRSRYEMEYAIEALLDKEPKYWRQGITLSGHKLTALYHCHLLCLVQCVDLSNNQLTHSLPQLAGLQCCQVLILDDNLMESLDGMPVLPRLNTLSLRNNKVTAFDTIHCLVPCTNLSVLDMRGNPIEKESKLEENVKCVLHTLKNFNNRTL